jgi:hypothetical protein
MHARTVAWLVVSISGMVWDPKTSLVHDRCMRAELWCDYA